MDALSRHCKFLTSSLSLTSFLPVRSEGGQDCQKAQDEAQAGGVLNSGGLGSRDSMGSGPLDSAGSSTTMDLGNVSCGPHDLGIEHDSWITGDEILRSL